MATAPLRHNPYTAKPRERRKRDPRMYDRKWREYRLRFLAENPLCVACMKAQKLEAATDVDHIRPIDGPDDPGYWDTKNHQGLCHSCHSEKTAKEDGGFGRMRKSA